VRFPRIALIAMMALLGIAAVRDFARLGDALPWRQLYEFREFYCAGLALDRGADPYRYEPLHSCEHAVDLSAAYRTDRRRIVPAPLPPYDFPPYMLAARFDFSTARVITGLAIVIAVAATIAAIVFVGVPIELAALAFALPGGFLLLTAGQIVPFALLALVLAGVALSHHRRSLASFFAALTLIEPHLGLPVCAAMMIWVPESRRGVLTMSLILAGIAALVVGLAGIAEYVTQVLPAQAAAETNYVYQYSLTYLLRTLGVRAAPALAIGEASYFSMLVLGVGIASRAARVTSRPELIAYLPAACSVVAGPYVHMVDMVFAIPAALVLAISLRGRSKNLAMAALCILAIPWIPVWITKKLFLATLFVVAALLLRLRAGPAVSIATFVSIALAIYVFELMPPAAFSGMTPSPLSPSDLAQNGWHAYVDTLTGAAANPLWLFIKVPTWLGLIAMFAAAFAAIREDRRLYASTAARI
jgi:hypothetical protein